MKKYFFIIIFLVIGLIVVFWLYFRIGPHKIFIELSRLKFWQIFIILFIFWFAFFLTTIRTRLILQDFCQDKIPMPLIIKARLAESALSYFTPIVYTGGESLRLIILKRERNILYSNNISTIYVEWFSQLLALAIFLIFSGTALLFINEYSLALTFLGLAFIIALVVFFLSRILSFEKLISALTKFLRLDRMPYFSEKVGQTSVAERIQSSLAESISYLKNQTKNFFLSVFISFIVLFLWAWQIKLLLAFMGENIPLAKIYVIKILIIVSGLAPVIARIGTFEAAYLASFAIFGLSSQLAFASALVMRVVELTVIGVGIIVSFRYLGEIIFDVTKIFTRKNSLFKHSNDGK
jgi:uncharacterized protein (TIRG00374 family)